MIFFFKALAKLRHNEIGTKYSYHKNIQNERGEGRRFRIGETCHVFYWSLETLNYPSKLVNLLQ